MEKQLKMDDAAARRLYPTAAPEFKEMLEQSFGKDFFETKVRDRIQNYNDVLNEINNRHGFVFNTSYRKSVIIPENFYNDKINTIECLIKMMQISDVYRKGRLPKKGEARYYAWWYLDSSSPSGLRFDYTIYADDYVFASSAAHLCFFSAEDAKDAALKFPEVYSGFFGAKLIV